MRPNGVRAGESDDASRQKKQTWQARFYTAGAQSLDRGGVAFLQEKVETIHNTRQVIVAVYPATPGLRWAM